MATATAPAKSKEQDKKKPPRDPAREVIETIVFVVVLVLLLKLFDTEAFVIPTGSMAETLYGYQKIIDCPKCGHQFPVNSTTEVEGQGGKFENITSYICPNCRYKGDIKDPREWINRTGDRVLVLKAIYHLRDPRRGEVVVFKYPKEPQKDQTATNYIKRVMGFGGETIAIYRGDLYVTTSLDYSNKEFFPRPDNPLDLWQPQYMYGDSPQALELFEASRNAGFPTGPIKDLPDELKKHFQDVLDKKIITPEQSGFVPIHKEEEHQIADLRLVWDNDKQAKDLAGPVPPRWYAPDAHQASWQFDNNKDQPKVFMHTGTGQDWIRYRHLTWKSIPEKKETIGEREILTPAHFEPWEWGRSLEQPAPGPVDNFLGYNAIQRDPRFQEHREPTESLWVGDLVLECEVDIPGGSEITLELSRGVNRFQAKFGKGQVSLSRVGPLSEEFKNPSRPCPVNAGTYKLRFGNIDNRLWVWVDGKRIDFGAEADYRPAYAEKFDKADVRSEGWTTANDVEAPASIGATGPVTAVKSIKLLRDIYYTTADRNRSTNPSTYYIQPGHYMCLGDNSSHSSDSRDWGLVPERLMLGKAVFVFWPAFPAPNRVGFIK